MSTVNLNNADAIYFGDRPVDRIYLGAQRVWPPLTLTERVRALFAPTDQGGMWDFTNPAGLYQDAAGTMPVTAVGQPIGRADDLSGNGNHLSQATTPARPTYTVDGALHDGVDDFLMAANAEDWTFLHDGSGGHLAFASSWLSDGPTGGLETGAKADGTNSVGLAVGRQASHLARSRVSLGNGIENPTLLENSGNGSLPADQVSSQAAEYEHPICRAWLNNNQWANMDLSGFTPSSDSPANPLRTITAPGNGSQVMRRLIAINRTLTESERASVNAWLMEGVE